MKKTAEAETETLVGKTTIEHPHERKQDEKRRSITEENKFMLLLRMFATAGFPFDALLMLFGPLRACMYHYVRNV